MATIEYIQQRIAGKEKEIDKLQKKLARIEKAEASGWQDNPYYYSERDKKYTARDLEEAKKGLEKYRADLKVATEKAGSRNIPAILKFLEMWKGRMTKFYGDGLKEYYEESAKVRELYNKYNNAWCTDNEKEAKRAYEEASEIFRNRSYGYFEEYEEMRYGRLRKSKRKIAEGEYEYLRPYNGCRNLDEAMAKLKKDLEDEANRKYDFIIERTNEITGKITDASLLEVGAKGDLNGFIKGERGTAKVQTIGAGGYNIQCFHFRTLIHKAG